MTKFWNWLSVSSADPTKLATTVKGFLVSFLPLLILALRYFGVETSEVGSLPEQIESLIVVFFGAVGGLLTAFGLLRKIYFTFK